MNMFTEYANSHARAMFVGQRIDTRAFENMHRLANSPLTVSAGTKGMAVVFRYGVVVFFNMSDSEIIAFLNDINNLLIEPIGEPEWDDVTLRVDESANEGIHLETITLQKINLHRLQLVAAIMAKSVVLAHYEVYLTKHFDRLEPLTSNLRSGFGRRISSRKLLQHIGEALTIEGKMVGRVEVSEKPELLWEQPEYDRLYLRLEDEFEIKERQQAIERKLQLSSHTAQTMLDILHTQRALRVEWYITILIVVEIAITLAEKI